MDWIDVAWHRDQWRTLVNKVINLRVLLNTGDFFIPEELLASQEGLCSIQLVKGNSNYEFATIQATFHLS
jgi:hypothetical protein